MNWSAVPISEFCKTGSGGTPSRGKPEYFNGAIPWVKSGELKENIIFETDEKISKEAVKSSNAKPISKGAILIAMYGATIGRVAILGIDAATNQAICHIIPDKDKVDNRFLFYALRNTVPELLRRKAGGAQPNISQAIIKDTKIPLPPLAEQKRIAAILDKADAIRRKRRQAIQLADEFLRSVFFGMFGDPATNPKGWPLHGLGDHLSFCTSGSRGWAKYYSPTGYRFIRSLDVRMNRISDENAVYVTPPDGAEANRTEAKPGDVLLTITGSKIGRVAPVPKHAFEKAFISQHVAILRLKDDFNPRFVSMFLSNIRGGQLQIKKLSYGQTKPGLNLQQVKELKIYYPPYRLQKKFDDLWDKAILLKIRHEGHADYSNTLFDSITQKAFRGEL